MKYKIIDILSSFSKEDIKKFADFLESPFFNKSKKLTRLYYLIIEFYPEFNSVVLNEENLMKKLNPGSVFNKSTVKNLLADLSAAAENYLAHTNFQSKEIEFKDFLRNEMFKRRLTRRIEPHIKKAWSLMNKSENKLDTVYIINKFSLLNDSMNLNTVNNPKSNYSAISSNIDLLNERGMYITYFFIKEIIREFDNLLSIDRTFNIDKEKNFIFSLFDKIDFKELLRFLISNSANKDYSISLEIYLSMLNAFSEPEEEGHYFKYKKLIMNNLQLFNTSEIRFHTIGLIRYCMLKSCDEKLSVQYDNERFEIYKFILENEFYKTGLDNYLPVELFRTVLLLALKLKKYKWVFVFIKNYKSKLHPDRRNNMYFYGCAEYYFYRGRYAEAMKSFHKVKLDHFLLKVDLKNLMLMTYFELGLFENAISLIDAYKHFLTNDTTLSLELKKKCKNFIETVNLMIIYHKSESIKSRHNIEKKLDSDFPYKEWVREKLSELIHNYDKNPAHINSQSRSRRKAV